MSKKTASLLLAVLALFLLGVSIILMNVPLAGSMSGNLVEAAAGGSIGVLLMLVGINVR